MEPYIIDRMHCLFQQWSGKAAERFDVLPQSGSYRVYCRLEGAGLTALAAYNTDLKENEAFVSFSRSFKKAGLPVPEVYRIEESGDLYLLEDLGTQTLFDCVRSAGFDARVLSHYSDSLQALVALQVSGKDVIDYSKCYPRAAFDRESMMWDLNYFKYYFLKLVRIPFDEQRLEDDFRSFVTYLMQEPADYFLFRDFQTANIMIREGKPYFIDYQGGRRGALQYDAASLLYDAKARMPKALRKQLTEQYIQALQARVDIDVHAFRNRFQGFVLIRLMQAMGAFGFRGIVEKKPGFMESIPFGLEMFADVLEDWSLPVEVPELKACFQRMLESQYLKEVLS